MFAKIIDDEIVYAKRIEEIDGELVTFPTDEQFRSAGFKPVICTEEPNDPPVGYKYVSGWDETETEIIQTWTLTPLPDDIDDSEAFNIIFGG